MLELIDVYKNYKMPRRSIFRPGELVEAVRGVSITVEEGKILGLVGESGCGKSTTARLMSRMETPDSGKIIYRGTDFGLLNAISSKEISRKIQIVMQNPYLSLPKHLNVREILTEPLRIHGVNRETHMERVEKVIEQIGLNRKDLDRYPGVFSGGQRQMISIGRAIILNPELVILDEATTALDSTVQAEILNLFNKLRQMYNFTYVVISHDLGVVRHMCDEIGVMYLGKLVEVGTNDSLFSRPQHPYTRALLDSIPTIEKGIKGLKPKIVKGEVPGAINPPKGCAFRSRCKVNTEACTADPPLSHIRDNHFVACHHPLSN